VTVSVHRFDLVDDATRRRARPPDLPPTCEYVSRSPVPRGHGVVWKREVRPGSPFEEAARVCII